MNVKNDEITNEVRLMLVSKAMVTLMAVPVSDLK